MIEHWFGWISFAFCMLLLLKYIGRISGHKKINKGLRKIHEPLGLAVIGISALHGIICFVQRPQKMTENITGWILILLLVFLARTFYARKKLKAKWFSMHRHLAIIFSVILFVHVVISL